jgi:hypothetical protein
MELCYNPNPNPIVDVEDTFYDVISDIYNHIITILLYFFFF